MEVMHASKDSQVRRITASQCQVGVFPYQPLPHWFAEMAEQRTEDQARGGPSTIC